MSNQISVTPDASTAPPTLPEPQAWNMEWEIASEVHSSSSDVADSAPPRNNAWQDSNEHAVIKAVVFKANIAPPVDASHFRRVEFATVSEQATTDSAPPRSWGVTTEERQLKMEWKTWTEDNS
jgi:hypothetical protein